MHKTYSIDEPITSEICGSLNIDKPFWYSDWQEVCEIMCAGPHPELERPSFYEREPNGLEMALAACKKAMWKRRYNQAIPGKGSIDPQLRPIRGCIVHREKVVETPTDWLGPDQGIPE